MKHIRKIYRTTLIASVIVVVAAITLVSLSGCAANMQQSAKPGAQLWGENCGRCHNIRPPASYQDHEWDVVVQHMRTRAMLTGDEADKIAEFLRASN